MRIIWSIVRFEQYVTFKLMVLQNRYYFLISIIQLIHVPKGKDHPRLSLELYQQFLRSNHHITDGYCISQTSFPSRIWADWYVNQYYNTMQCTRQQRDYRCINSRSENHG